MNKLIDAIEDSFQYVKDNEPNSSIIKTFNEFIELLNSGQIRAAIKENGKWQVNLWVKKGILLGFKIGELKDYSINNQFRYFDKTTYPLRPLSIDDRIRIVPGGSSIRNGCYVGKNVTCMPPMYINVGAYVDEGTMIDSHALVGSCAQIGARVHLSAGSQIGGVLEPIGSIPVIIEDDVLIGGNCGIYEGTIVREKAVIGAGVIITGATQVFDLVKEKVYRKSENAPLEIPEGAVVVPGSRPVTKGMGKEYGISLYTPVIVKYRDTKTEKSVKIENLLR
ncbi:2,3,4,5-tetrahydropyridine-2,6-dicarboxylate N-succinyltransferase [bacterium]|nr:2,3,4,5-tetrahydropyridine-2,6-dicarboxylate N-succinyltransferase [bacterium]